MLVFINEPMGIAVVRQQLSQSCFLSLLDVTHKLGLITV